MERLNPLLSFNLNDHHTSILRHECGIEKFCIPYILDKTHVVPFQELLSIIFIHIPPYNRVKTRMTIKTL